MKKIFVFGSNEAGRHGAGAAGYAQVEHGAKYGQGWGLQGNSFAIPTKNHFIRTLPLERINKYVQDFLFIARENPDLEFNLTCIGCGLAGYEVKDIAPMFADAPPNVIMPKPFQIFFKGEYYDPRGFEHST